MRFIHKNSIRTMITGLAFLQLGIAAGWADPFDPFAQAPGFPPGFPTAGSAAGGFSPSLPPSMPLSSPSCAASMLPPVGFGGGFEPAFGGTSAAQAELQQAECLRQAAEALSRQLLESPPEVASGAVGALGSGNSTSRLEQQIRELSASVQKPSMGGLRPPMPPEWEGDSGLNRALDGDSSDVENP